ncbi:hypothetical protein COOONC_27017 [Cooperia oncophora]
MMLASLRETTAPFIHYAPTDDEVMVANTEYPQGERKKREAAWDWIRIETECHGRTVTKDPAMTM